MIHLNAITLFIEEQEQVSSLVGNCGRKVRRFLQHYFTQRAARFTLTSEHEHLMQFAYNVGQMDWAALMAKESLQHTEAYGNLNFTVENIDQKAGTMQVVVTVNEVPEGVKARQQLLENIAFALRRFQAMGFMNRPQPNIEAFLQDAFGVDGAAEPVDTSLHRAQFDKLLASDFSELEDISGYITTLAGYLNPAVSAEVERLEAEDDRAFDAAFAFHAMESDVARGKLFAELISR